MARDQNITAPQPDAASGKPRKGVLLALLAFAIYATHDVAIKLLGETYSPFQIIFFVVLFSFPVVSLMLVSTSSKESLRPRLPYWTALRTVAVVITGFCSFYAFTVLPLAETYAILFAAPLMITILSIPLLGEVVGRHRWAAVVVGLIGVLVVLRPGSSDLGLGLGHLAALFGAFGAALTSVVMRKVGGIERREVLLLYPMLANFAATLIILPFVYIPMSLGDLGLTLMISILATIAMTLMIRAYTLADAAIVAPMQYSQIIWATVFGWLVFGETSDVMMFLGAAIIIASGAYIVIREARQSSAHNRPVLNSLNRRPEMAGLPRLGIVTDTTDTDPD